MTTDEPKLLHTAIKALKDNAELFSVYYKNETETVRVERMTPADEPKSQTYAIGFTDYPPEDRGGRLNAKR